jgi:diguanylate cyclase (GGDEF)-like protein
MAMKIRDPGSVASRAAASGLGLVLVVVCSAALVISQRLGAQIEVAGNASLDDDLFHDAQYVASHEQLQLTIYRLEGRPAALEAYRSSAGELDDIVGRAVALDAVEGGDGSDDTAVLRELLEVHGRFRAEAETVIGHLERGDRATAESIALARVDPLADQILGELHELEIEHDRATDAAMADIREDGRLLRLGTPIALLLTIVLLLGLWWVTHTHSRAVKRQTLHDALTGLPNRALFGDRAAQALHAAVRRGDQPVVMMLDLDRFKEVNDTLGHHAGDALLLQVADRLVASLRPTDTVARFGGDEFAVLLPAGGHDLGTEIAGRIVRALEPAFTVDGVSIGVEASIGIATADARPAGPGVVEDQVEDLLRQADTAMYIAKSERCGFSHYAAGDAGSNTTEHLSLLSELREALEHDQLVLHYQPKVSADTGALTGVEALVRWEHPTRGMIPPDRFIPLAEGTTLIHRLTDVVLTRALRFARGWLDEGVRVPVSVNVSARTLLDRDFPARVADRLEAAGVPAELLGLEITESTIMLDPDRALAILRELREMGIHISVDDFGTGYSSMAYLKLLPVNELKVDRSFVRHMAGDREDAMLVQSAIDLGHNLGLSVVAEGVEDGATLVALQRLGADDVQGYYLGRPMPEEAMREWMVAKAGPASAVAGTVAD